MQELSDFKGGTQTVGICKFGAEENIWSWNRMKWQEVEKTA
jgi:hypothetical protein